MTRIYPLNENKIIVNNVQLNRETVCSYLIMLYQRFPHPREFKIGHIDSSFCKKTDRCMIHIFEYFEFIERVPRKRKIPYFYRFKEGIEKKEMIQILSSIG